MRGSAQSNAEMGRSSKVVTWMAGLGPRPRALESEKCRVGWLLTLFTGQVWLVPELRRILDKLDVALALLHGGL